MNEKTVLKLGLPKGRMQAEVLRLMSDAGLPVRSDERDYRPRVGDQAGSPLYGSKAVEYEAKFLKPRNIVEMLETGSRDLGFAGADWVRELDAEAVELLDTGLDPVRIVAAAPDALAARMLDGKAASLKIRLGRNPVLASEYENLSREWIASTIPETVFVRSYGATEVFPPEDADIIVDNCASGSTLKANGLSEVATIMASTTRLYASRSALSDPAKKEAAESLALLLRSVLEARRRVMVEVNVDADSLEALVAILPCMRSPTISPLDGGKAFAVRVAAPREGLAALLPEIKRRGGTDIVVAEFSQLVP